MLGPELFESRMGHAQIGVTEREGFAAWRSARRVAAGRAQEASSGTPGDDQPDEHLDRERRGGHRQAIGRSQPDPAGGRPVVHAIPATFRARPATRTTGTRSPRTAGPSRRRSTSCTSRGTTRATGTSGGRSTSRTTGSTRARRATRAAGSSRATPTWSARRRGTRVRAEAGPAPPPATAPATAEATAAPSGAGGTRGKDRPLVRGSRDHRA